MISEIKELEKIDSGLIKYDYDISGLTTWKIGGKVKGIVFPEYESQVFNVVKFVKENNIPFYIIGKGSNILFGNKYFEGLIIYLGKKFNSYELLKEVKTCTLNCSSGISLMNLGKIAKNNSLTGFEYLSFIPGTLGGAIITNAEAHKKSISELIISVKVIENGSIKVYTNEMCKFGYRTSIFENTKELIILSAKLILDNGLEAEIAKKINLAKDFRINKQPKKPSAGSVFKNPEIDSAGKIIDDLGLKGISKGDAKISNIHGNFIINVNQAHSDDILYLINLIQEKVKEKYDITLDLEIKLFNI